MCAIDSFEMYSTFGDFCLFVAVAVAVVASSACVFACDCVWVLLVAAIFMFALASIDPLVLGFVRRRASDAKTEPLEGGGEDGTAAVPWTIESWLLVFLFMLACVCVGVWEAGLRRVSVRCVRMWCADVCARPTRRLVGCWLVACFVCCGAESKSGNENEKCRCRREA